MQFFNFLISHDRRRCPDSKDAQEIGKFGERAAEAFLRRKGYKTLVKNYKGEHGEIDLVCRHQNTLVFVEVKARSEGMLDRPAAAVNKDKQKKMIKTAKTYLSELKDKDLFARFDIVEVYLKSNEMPRCELIPSAFVV